MPGPNNSSSTHCAVLSVHTLCAKIGQAAPDSTKHAIRRQSFKPQNIHTAQFAMPTASVGRPVACRPQQPQRMHQLVPLQPQRRCAPAHAQHTTQTRGLRPSRTLSYAKLCSNFAQSTSGFVGLLLFTSCCGWPKGPYSSPAHAHWFNTSSRTQNSAAAVALSASTPSCHCCGFSSASIEGHANPRTHVHCALPVALPLVLPSALACR